jgi:hypothetical protein
MSERAEHHRFGRVRVISQVSYRNLSVTSGRHHVTSGSCMVKFQMHASYRCTTKKTDEPKKHRRLLTTWSRMCFFGRFPCVMCKGVCCAIYLCVRGLCAFAIPTCGVHLILRSETCLIGSATLLSGSAKGVENAFCIVIVVVSVPNKKIQIAQIVFRFQPTSTFPRHRLINPRSQLSSSESTSLVTRVRFRAPVRVSILQRSRKQSGNSHCFIDTGRYNKKVWIETDI